MNSPTPRESASAQAVRDWYTRSRPWVWPVIGVLWCLFGLAFDPLSPANLAAAVLGGLAIVVRVRTPGWSLTASWAAATAMMLPTSTIGFFPTTAIIMSLAGASRYGSLKVRRSSGISVIVGGLIAGAYLTYFPQKFSIGYAPDVAPNLERMVFLTVMTWTVLAAAWMYGRLGFIRDRARQRQTEAVLATQRAIEERERTNVARDMHDVLAHSLSVIVTLADGTRLANPDANEQVKNSLRDISGVGRDALAEVRGLLSRLRRTDENQIDPNVTMDTVLADMRLAGTEIILREQGEAPPLIDPAYRAITLILREALTNALRHGTVGTPVFVYLNWGELTLEVRNSIDPKRAHSANPGGWGITGMKERAALIGGALSAAPDGADWVLNAKLGGTANE